MPNEDMGEWEVFFKDAKTLTTGCHIALWLCCWVAGVEGCHAYNWTTSHTTG